MKNFLFILICTFITSFLSAQCTPDPQYSAAGIYPDTTTGLAPAYVGQSYSQNITVITPTDTTVALAGQTVSVDIDSIVLTSVTNLPPNFYYACDPPSCGFPGGTIKCAELYSTTDPIASDIGVYNIIFETTSYASNVPFVGTYEQEDVIDYYYIEISDATAVLNLLDIHTFELKDIYPNPVFDQARIQFISGLNADIVFKIYNLLGEEIESQLISSSRGVNTVNLNTSLYSEGMYLYSINNGKEIQTKRMIVRR